MKPTMRRAALALLCLACSGSVDPGPPNASQQAFPPATCDAVSCWYWPGHACDPETCDAAFGADEWFCRAIEVSPGEHWAACYDMSELTPHD